MQFPINVISPSGAVILGSDVVCDGFVDGATARVQTHVHKDHMDDFETSKGLQQIVLSEATRQLLILEYGADLPYRTNVIALDELRPYAVGDSQVTLISSGHMLGAVQVAVQLRSGLRLGYSGDFSWPLDHVVEVDALVVDSTYGSPDSVRQFSQGECEERFVALLRRLLARGPVHIKAHRGTLHRALQLISDDVRCPIVASERLMREVSVYRAFAYGIQPLVSEQSDTAQAVRTEGHYVRVYGTGDKNPVDLQHGSRISLSAFFSRGESPIVEYSDRSYCVAMSNHADFDGTLSYVKATGARFVVTDNVRGPQGCRLATEIEQRLGVDARPSSEAIRHAWGAVPE